MSFYNINNVDLYNKLEPIQKTLMDMECRIRQLEEEKIRNQIEHKQMDDQIEALWEETESEGKEWCCEHEKELSEINHHLHISNSENNKLLGMIKKLQEENTILKNEMKFIRDNHTKIEVANCGNKTFGFGCT